MIKEKKSNKEIKTEDKSDKQKKSKSQKDKEKVEVKEEEEEKAKQSNIKEIADLPGVGPAAVEKLKDFAIVDLLGVAASDPMTLANAGITGKTAVNMIKAARDALNMGFDPAIEVEKKREKIGKISTGLKSFDDLLAGGYETGCITEVHGAFGGGKTQLAHILCVTTQQADPNAEVFYIDSENTFRPDRIRQLAKGMGEDPDKIIQNIRVARAYNADHQMLLVDKAEELIATKKHNVKTIIVDSLTSHFRAEYQGMGSLAPRQQKMNKHLHHLLKIADKYNIVVFITNQVMSSPGMLFGDPTVPIGGHILGHASTFRLYIRPSKKGSRVVKLIDSPNLPNGETAFYVEEGGLKDL